MIMTRNWIVVLAAFGVASGTLATTTAHAQEATDAGTTVPTTTTTATTAPPPVDRGAESSRVTPDHHDDAVYLEKLIDSRIKKAAEDANKPTPTVGEGQKEVTPAFSFANFAWSPSNLGSSDRPLTWGPFTGEIRMDTVIDQDFTNPIDHTISGSSEVFRSNELQLTQLGFGGDFLYKNVWRA